MYKAVIIGMDRHVERKSDLESADLAIDFKTWEELTDDTIIQYNLVAIHLEQSHVDLIHFIRQKFHSQPVAILVFLSEADIEAASDFIASGADIAEVLPTAPEGFLPILEYALDLLEIDGVQHDSISNSITESVQEVFATMVRMSVKLNEISHEKLRMPDDDLAVLMHVEGEMKGFIILLMSYDLGARVISRILAIEPELLSHPDIEEGIFEILNMIAGGTKARISDFNRTFTLTPPKALDEKNKDDHIEKIGTVLHLENDAQDQFSIFYHFE